MKVIMKQENKTDTAYFFWLGEDGATPVTEEEFFKEVLSYRERERKWREVDIEGVGGIEGIDVVSS